MAMSKMSHLLFKENTQQPKQFRGGEKKVMKKSLSLLLAIAMVFSMFASVVSAADEKSVGEKLKEAGIITGDTNGDLKENDTWARKDLAVILARLSGAETEAKTFTGEHGFTDVNSSFYNPIVAWAKSEGLVQGVTETTFDPNGAVTNYQFATLILRVLDQEQDEYAANLTKAIELGLFPAGTEGSVEAKRAALYSVIEATLNTVVEGGKKLGTVLNLKGYEVIDLAVESASAIVAKTIKVTFNDDLASVDHYSITVVDAGGATVAVEKVTVDGKVATVSLAQELAQKAYTIKVTKAASKAGSQLTAGSAEFTYTKGVPATVAFNSLVVAKNTGGTIGYTVKDAAGNDITADFPLSDFSVKSSNESYVTSALVPYAVGMSTVVLTLDANTEVTTGNQNINVVEAVSLEITKAELTAAGDTTKSEIYLGSNNASVKANVVVETKNQNGSQTLTADGLTVSYVSSNPTIVAVTNGQEVDGSGSVVDATNDAYVTALQPGSATITVTAKQSDKTVTTSFVVTVKAKKKLASFTVDKTNLTIVDNVNIDEEFTITAMDQYGNVLKEAVNFTVASSKVAVADIVGAGSAGFTATTDASTGKVKVYVYEKTTGSASISVKASNDSSIGSKNVGVSVVSKAALGNGYEVVISGTKLDSRNHTTDTGKQGPQDVTIKVYQKDVNGNRAAAIVYGNAVNSNIFTVTPKDGANSTLEVNAEATYNGKITVKTNDGVTKNETIEVKVNNVVIATYVIELSPSYEKAIKTVTRIRESIEVNKGADVNLIGDASAAFSVFNQYGDRLGGTDIATAAAEGTTKNPTLVTFAGNKFTASSTNTGRTTVTVKIGGTWYELEVVVK